MLTFKMLDDPYWVMIVSSDPNVVAASMLDGKPPYLVTFFDKDRSIFHNNDWYSLINYISSDNPCPRDAVAAYPMWKHMEVNGWEKLLVVAYPDDVITAKDFQNLMIFYDRIKMDQVESLISQLNWDKVKLDQQDQFLKGLRMIKINPMLGLQICVDAYDFDPLEINWADPRTYWNGFKEILGVAKSVI